MKKILKRYGENTKVAWTKIKRGSGTGKIGRQLATLGFVLYPFRFRSIPLLSLFHTSLVVASYLFCSCFIPLSSSWVAWGGDLEEVIPHDDLVIAKSVKLKPGVYELVDGGAPGVLQIKGDGITVEATGVTLRGTPVGTLPDQRKGIGMLIQGSKGVTITGGRFQGFFMGVKAIQCEDLTLEGCDVSDNYTLRLKLAGDPWLDIRNGEAWRRYGAGIWLEGCRHARVKGCKGRRQQNGLLLMDSTQCEAFANDFSFNSGWGIGLYGSSENHIARNTLDFVLAGGDAAGISIVNGSHRNKIEHNSFTHCGVGLFLTNRRDVGKVEEGSCFENLIAFNDGSYAGSNGFEVTFSRGTTLIGNYSYGSNYGLWGGYSSSLTVSDNMFSFNRTDGIAIEHGQGSVIDGNTIIRNGQAGIRLWMDPERVRRQRHPASQDYVIRGNQLGGNGAGAVVDSHTVGLKKEANDEHPRADEKPLPLPPSVPRLGGFAEEGWALMKMGPWGPLDFVERWIYAVTPWTDWNALRLPLTQASGVVHLDGLEIQPGNPMTLNVVGPPGTLVEIPSVEGVMVSPASGRLPFTVTLSAQPEAKGLMMPFSLSLTVSGEVVSPAEGAAQPFLSGMVGGVSWKVSYYPWPTKLKEAGRAAMGDTKAWRILFDEGEAAAVVGVPALHFRWGLSAPHPKAPADFFATRAETTVEVAQDGRYELRTISDDGVRVFLDGKDVLADWTWHGSKEHRVTLALTKGRHDLVVEHCDIDGPAELQVRFSASR